ncbi:MAG: hypothetical protein D6E12_15930 [Desulfovibrio sp.]|nr:MAG: hypothetical protein D6E12_15930 [Desulfovibrio sp.]
MTQRNKRILLRCSLVAAFFLSLCVLIGAHQKPPPGYIVNIGDTWEYVVEEAGEPDFSDPLAGSHLWINNSGILGWWEMEVVFSQNGYVVSETCRRYVGFRPMAMEITIGLSEKRCL